MNAQQAFETLKQVVINACRLKNYSIAVEAAKNMGFHVHQVSPTSQVLAKLSISDASGGSVFLVAKWHDPSGPFQNLPDINRIRLSLSLPDLPEINFMDEYED